MARMGQVQLVDACLENIWGPRLRRSDVEKGHCVTQTSKMLFSHVLKGVLRARRN
ncbi:hypothetical protein BS17DRAFT_778921 [Gyrodon lividus]|nr:hypothetical protein BS17DRAFT_778921 [Gyrodon lividus]